MSNVAVQMRPELLKAAKRGDWGSLDGLMSEAEQVATVPQVIVNIEEDDDGEPPVTWTHTYGPDSVLHVVASSGDDEDFLRSATVVYNKAKHLLGTCNAAGDTPLHCAARAGSVKMLEKLIGLVSGEDDGASRLQAALRKHNHRGETALHEAVRWGDREMVSLLMREDAELARFPRANGASPLYLAILLRHYGIAGQLHQLSNNQLSYCGPDGQNALHAAARLNEWMTEKLLVWNSSLTKQGDRRGRTPLHFVASVPPHVITRLVRGVNMLLDADQSSAYQSDDNGLFPIHVAALHKNFGFIRILLRKCPDCAQLRDGQGRTFLHITIENSSFPVSTSIRSLLLQKNQVRKLAAILNAQDDEGNTALHYAVMAGRPRIVHRLIWNKEVQLSLQNNEGQTPMDLSRSRTLSGIFYNMDPNIRIRNLLGSSFAKFGVPQGEDKVHVSQRDVMLEEKIKDSTPTIAVAAVLIITVSFTAAFQLPGGYTTNKPEGTPELANKYSFQAFLVANNLAFVCSTLSTMCLMYAGVSIVDIATRRAAFRGSILFLNGSARSLVAAFALGTHAVLAPVAHAASVLTWISVGLLMLDVAWFTCTRCIDHIAVIGRLGILKACFRVTRSIILAPLWRFWPYVVIGLFISYLKTRGIH